MTSSVPGNEDALLYTSSGQGENDINFSLSKMLEPYVLQASGRKSANSKYDATDQQLSPSPANEHQLLSSRPSQADKAAVASLDESYLDAIEDIDLDIVEHVPGFFDDEKSPFSDKK
jgi:hypothetical protein